MPEAHLAAQRTGTRSGDGRLLVPVRLRRLHRARVSSLQFAAQILGDDGMPVHAQSIEFVPAADVPAPDVSLSEADGTLLLAGCARSTS